MSKAQAWWLWSVIMGLAILGACWWIAWQGCGKAKGGKLNEVKAYRGKCNKDYLEVIGK